MRNNIHYLCLDIVLYKHASLLRHPVSTYSVFSRCAFINSYLLVVIFSLSSQSWRTRILQFLFWLTLSATLHRNNCIVIHVVTNIKSNIEMNFIFFPYTRRHFPVSAKQISFQENYSSRNCFQPQTITDIRRIFYYI